MAASDRNNAYMHEEVAKHGTKPSNGKVLVVFAPSGVARRYRGTYFVMQIRSGDTGFYCPAVLLADGSPLALDPRSVVFDDGNLAPLWNPRGDVDKLSPKVVEWLERNPDVFVPAVRRVDALAEPEPPPSPSPFSPN